MDTERRKELSSNIDRALVSVADLHVHSKYSTKPTQWLLRRLGCQESYLEPSWVYTTEKALGMDFVTITDHNVIDGALEIAHHPDVVVGEEVTTYFPEDDCKIHVQVLGIDERIHEDIASVRDNIYELVAYLREKNVVHYVTHPFYAINDRLKRYHIERLLLLFPAFETVNGSRKAITSMAFERLLGCLTRDFLLELADRNPMDLEPILETRRGMAGGSDDHGGLFVGHAYTVVPKAATPEEFLSFLRSGQSRGAGRYGSPLGLAHSLYAIAYQFLAKDVLKEVKKPEDLLFSLLDKISQGSGSNGENPQSGAKGTLQSAIAKKVKRLIERYEPREDIPKGDQALLRILGRRASFLTHSEELSGLWATDEAKWEAINENYLKLASGISQHMTSNFVSKFLKNLKTFKILDNFNHLSALAMVQMLLMPYFFSYHHQNKDKKRIREVLDGLGLLESLRGEPLDRRVWFSDTIFDVNGVARTILEMARSAKRGAKDLKVVACPQNAKIEAYLEDVFVKFLPLLTFPIPEYESIKLYVPPLLDIVEFCEREGFDSVISSTPGPMGLAGLLVARLLDIPINGIYHTDIPQYVRILTGDFSMEEMSWRYIRWYYEQMDIVFVPSKATMNQLVQNGFTPDKIKVFPRGIDIQRFHPRFRNQDIWKNFSTNGGTKLLYVGRVSKEKGLDLLIDAYLFVKERHKNTGLIVVGDGPYLGALKAKCEGSGITFTGPLEGEELSSVYASADIFVFPSSTDTFGNVVLEAQASGIPVVVADEGGPSENLEAGRTGLVFKAGSSFALVKAIEELLESPARRQEMAIEARRYMENRSFDKAFEAFWQMHARETFALKRLS
ncbi:MAG: glycosyltransferase [Nitrospirota bacterium]|nr:glycosyltransferase [Nitrospirota bacterium]